MRNADDWQRQVDWTHPYLFSNSICSISIAYTGYYICIFEFQERCVSSQILPGWWIGGCQANKYRKHWSGIVDLTNELPEACFSDHYHLVPCWDGNPPSLLSKSKRRHHLH